MSDAARALILRHWDTANRRDWRAFESLLGPQLHYDLPQSREYLESARGDLEMFRTWPGEWQARIPQRVCEPSERSPG